MFALVAPIPLRSEFDASTLRLQARRARDASQARRLLALAPIYDGGSLGDAARVGGVTVQIVRDWVLRFNAEGVAGLVDRKAPGKSPLLTPAQRTALAQAVEAGPTPSLDGVVRWRLVDLVQWLWQTFGVSISRQTLGRELRRMGFRKLSARPRHYGQDPEAMEAFKKTSQTAWRKSGRSSRPRPSSNYGGKTVRRDRGASGAAQARRTA